MSPDQFDEDLRAVMRRVVAPEAPDELRLRIAAVTDAPATRTPRFGLSRWLATGAAVAAVAVALAFGLTRPPSTGPGPSSTPQPSSPIGIGISASKATQLARSHVQAGAVFVSAVAGKYRDVFTIAPAGRTIDQPNRLVWAVTFDANYEICPPNGTPCWTPRAGQTQVILDYITGEFLESGTFAPASGTAAPTTLPPGPDVKFAGLIDARNGWALTTTGLFLTADGGTTWRGASVPGPQTGRGVLGVGFADAHVGWLATLDSADPFSKVFDVWRTDDGARTWQRVVVPEGANQSETMGRVEFSILDADHLFLMVEGGMPSGYNGDLYESADGGRTWSPDRLAGGNGVTGPFAFADAQHGVIAGGAPGNRLFMTADGGRSWRPVGIPIPAGMDPTYTEFWNAPRFWDARRGGLAVTYGTDVRSMELGILVTSDAGASWSLAATIPTQPNDVPVAFLSPSEWVTMPDANTRLRTTDGGKTWIRAASKGLPGAQWLRFADADTGWALMQLNWCGGSLGVKSVCHSLTSLFATRDGGTTWAALWPK